MKTTLYTIFALIAFAGNSVLCRLALGENTIDAASFTTIRLLSGILMLVIILKINKALSKRTVSGVEKLTSSTSKGSWRASFFLFLYAATFSFAYISLETGIGAMILFGSVQISMILISLFSGNKLQPIEWIGILVAFSGFVYLLMPDLTTPSLLGFVLMTISGVAWALYTLAGKGSKDPLSDTAYNFLRTSPFVIIFMAVTLQDTLLTQQGIGLAILSGAITSGVGYAIWYAAMNGLSSTQAAVVQLSVPVIAAVGGVLFLEEVISLRLILASMIILSGMLAVILGKNYMNKTLTKSLN